MRTQKKRTIKGFVIKHYRIWLRDIVDSITNVFSTPNEDAYLIFGLQKSGTTAIASLLAKKTGLSATIDTRFLWEPYLSELATNKLDLKKHIYFKSYPFSKEIIKEPNLSFFMDELHQIFKMNKYVVIIRNPFDNIRSILNSLSLPGNADSLDMNNVPYYWRTLLTGNSKKNYIETLAEKWVDIYSNIINKKENACILIKYEDFITNKEAFISKLAIDLEIEPKNNISKIIDKPFNKPGDKNTNLYTFFGKKNFNSIQTICNELMNEYNYIVPL